MHDYVIVIKEGLFWLAKKVEIQYLGDDIHEYGTRILYEIDMTLEHNGFEYEVDAWSYLVHIQDKEAEELLDGKKKN